MKTATFHAKRRLSSCSCKLWGLPAQVEVGERPQRVGLAAAALGEYDLLGRPEMAPGPARALGMLYMHAH